jgi:enoyl-CoA hydratase
MKEFETILYENPAEHVARIVLNKPETRNSQDTQLLYELNDAFDVAAQDDNVKVIILAANGPHFSSGHDLREKNPYEKMSEFRMVGTWCGFTCAGAEAQMAREKEIYIGFSER